MRIIAIASYKGGTGKTTTAINMAFDIARLHGKNVLVVDADAQGNASYELLKSASARFGLYDVMTGKCKIRTAICRSRFEGVDILPCKENIEELELDSPYDLSDRLGELVCSSLEQKKQYDFVIIDCHPSMQPGTIMALTACDDVIIPVKADRYSANGLEIMLEFVKQIKKSNPDLQCRCLATMYRETRAQEKILLELLEQTQCDMFNSCIRYCEAVNSSQDIRKPLLKHRRKSNAALDYVELTEEYMHSVEEEL